MMDSLFEGWSFLVAEITFLLLAAGLLGLFVGWLLRAMMAWGLRSKVEQANKRVFEKEDQIAILENDILKLKTRYSDNLAEIQERLTAAESAETQMAARLERIDTDHDQEIEALRASVADRDRRILDLETNATAPSSNTQRMRVTARTSSNRSKELPEATLLSASRKARSKPTVVPLQAGMAETPKPFEPETPYEPEAGVLEDTVSTARPEMEPEAAAVAPEPTQPERLSAARDGQPDDLKRINGIGPKIEAQCHALGIFHFDQIAAFTEAELAWVDENLEGFTGHASRDQWVSQAKDLIAARDGGDAEDVDISALKFMFDER